MDGGIPTWVKVTGGITSLALVCLLIALTLWFLFKKKATAQATTQAATTPETTAAVGATGSTQAGATSQATAPAVSGASPAVAAGTAAPYTTAPPTPAVTLAPMTQYLNYDLTGDEVSTTLTDPQLCKELCRQKQSCTFYVTDSAGTTCWLKKNAGAFVRNTDRVAYAPAAVPPPANPFTPVLQMNAWGNDLGSPLNLGQADCNQACIDTAGCSYYVVDGKGKHCWLKTGTQPNWQPNGDIDAYVPDGVPLPWVERKAFDNWGTHLLYSDTDAKSCSRLCGKTASCKFYVTDSAGTKCWLKSSVGPDVPDPNFSTWTFPGQPFAQPQATLYKDCGFGGQSAVIDPGSYGVMPNGFPNDALSSLRVPGGFAVQIFTDTNFGGASTKLTGDVSCLGKDFNDKTSSLKYFKA